jgi:hypothetical protein
MHVGQFVLRARHEAMVRLPWHQFFRREFWEQAGPRMRAIGLQWAVGMFVLAIIAGTLTYMLLVEALRRRRDRERTSFLGLH